MSADLDELTDTVTSYVSFCEDLCVPTRNLRIYSNNKPWFTTKLKQLRHSKEEAYRKGDRMLYNQARNVLTREIRAAKRNYSEKLKNQFSTNEPANMWKTLRNITGYSKPPPQAEGNQQLADDLNVFYCRFEKNLQPLILKTSIPDGPTIAKPPIIEPIPLGSQSLVISEKEVQDLFHRQKPGKAPGPDKITPFCLKVCADQLAPIFTQIFNKSLEMCYVPSCFKRSTIIPVPKKPSIKELNDYRPVALTSVVMKTFERLVMSHLKIITDPLLDPLQFAYRANRSTDDAVNMALHYILQHLESPRTYVRVLFVDFSSAFNTIIPDILLTKLSQLVVPEHTCKWITSFLTDRKQQVKLGKITSDTCTISTGPPQGCVLSPLLFSLYTNDCISNDPSVKLLKFADDITVIGLIRDNDETAYRREVEQLVSWCHQNNLELNTFKTVEMVVDFRRNSPILPPLTILDKTVSTVKTFKFLGSIISQDLKWSSNIKSVIKKAQQRMFFLRQLRKLKLPKELLIQFYRGIIESVICSSITVWFGSATQQDRYRLQRIIRTAEKTIAANLPSIEDLYTARVKKRAVKIFTDPSHPGHKLFQLLPSKRRYRVLHTKTTRHKNSFFPNAIILLNK